MVDTTLEILGIDIGGSGIKGAPVNIETGELITERHRIETPQPAKPDPVTDIVAELVKHFNWKGPVGCTFPAIIKNGIAHSAANVDDEWIGTNAQHMIQDKTGLPVLVLNDADAAGIAEMRYGAGRDRHGVIVVLTVGTGIGSAIFVNGQMMPNTELGHLEIRGKIGEDRASDRARKDKEYSWDKWAKKFNEYLLHIEFLLNPDLFIIGGGISKKWAKYHEYLHLHTEIIPAELLNEAGIIGAAVAASEIAQEQTS